MTETFNQTILLVDVEGYSAKERTNEDRLALKGGLERALATAFREAEVRWDELKRQDTGDGWFVLVPAAVGKRFLVERFPHVLVAEIRDHNAVNREQARMRVRMVLDVGEIAESEHGVTSPAIITAARLLDARPLKEALAGSKGVLVVGISSWLYKEVVLASAAADACAYRRIKVKVQETREHAWVARPDDPYTPKRARAVAWRIPVLAGSVVVLLVAGYLVLTPANPTAAPRESIVGAPRTADPCAVTFPDALGGYGVVEQSDDYGNFNRCDALVYPSGDHADYVDVSVEFATGAADPLPVQWDGGFGLQRPAAEPSHCTRILLLPDAGTRLVVDADGDPAGTHDFCGMAEAAATRARTAMADGQVPRRQLPAGSLAGKDACALLDTAATTEALGTGPVEQIPGFANWACVWNYTDRPGLVKILFDRTATEIRQPGTPLRLGKFAARVQPQERGDTSCTVTIVYHDYVDTKGQRTDELAVVDVDKSDARPEDLCVPARKLAAVVAKRL